MAGVTALPLRVLVKIIIIAIVGVRPLGFDEKVFMVEGAPPPDQGEEVVGMQTVPVGCNDLNVFLIGILGKAVQINLGGMIWLV